MSKAASRGSVRRMTGLSLLTAIIAVLTVLGNFVRFGPFPITLALAPIIIGAAMYGPSAGAILGGVFGLVTLLQRPCRLGRRHGDIPDGRAACGMHPWCVLKGAGAGWLAGLAYRLAARKSGLVGVIAAGIVCPVVNTGLLLPVCFSSSRPRWRAGQAGRGVLYFVIFGLTGVNFLVELAVNLVLASGITQIIKYTEGRKSK